MSHHSALNNTGMGAQAAPRDISARNNLGHLAGQLDAINSMLGDCNEKMAGESELSKTNSAPSSEATLHGLVDHCQMLANSIRNRLEFLSARL